MQCGRPLSPFFHGLHMCLMINTVSDIEDSSGLKSWKVTVEVVTSLGGNAKAELSRIICYNRDHDHFHVLCHVHDRRPEYHCKAPEPHGCHSCRPYPCARRNHMSHPSHRLGGRSLGDPVCDHCEAYIDLIRHVLSGCHLSDHRWL